MKLILKLLVCTLLTFTFSCEKAEPTNTNNNGTSTTTKSSAKDITKFNFAAFSPVIDATIDATNKTISATVPAATDVTKLVPTITLSDKATVSPATGVTQDFSKEVSYTVTAEDASTIVYKVKVTKAISSGGGTNSENVIYLTKTGTTTTIVALDPVSGKELGSFANGDNTYHPAPFLYENGALLLSSSFGSLVKNELLDVSNGKQKISIDDKYNIGFQAVMENGTVYYLSQKNNISESVAMDWATGKEKWRTNSFVNNRVAVDGLLYSTNSGTGLFCTDGANGTKKWEETKNLPSDIINPVVVDGFVYYATKNNEIVALNAKTGVLVWKYQIIKEGKFSLEASPTVSNGIFYIATNDVVYGIDTKTGTLKWSKNLGVTSTFQNNKITDLAVGNDVVFFNTTDDRLIGMNAGTGEVKWTIKKVFHNLIFANGVLYTGNTAIDPVSGTFKWELTDTKYYPNYSFCVIIKNKAYYPASSGMQQ